MLVTVVILGLWDGEWLPLGWLVTVELFEVEPPGIAACCRRASSSEEVIVPGRRVARDCGRSAREVGADRLPAGHLARGSAQGKEDRLVVSHLAKGSEDARDAHHQQAHTSRASCTSVTL